MGPQNENAPSATWSTQVPDEVNDVLREQAPGTANRDFRLQCRKAWVATVRDGAEFSVRGSNAWQDRVAEMVAAMLPKRP